MSPSNTVDVRDALITDVDDILLMIGELADYEKLRHQVKGSRDDLARHLFGADPFARALIAAVDGQTVGFALYFFNYSTFLCKPGLYLEDLYVRPVWRRHGVGARLLAMLAQRAVSRDCGRMEWAVLDWNQPAIEFYRRLGALPQDEWTTYRLTGEALTRLASG